MAEGGDAVFDGRRLFFKSVFAGREEENELRVGEYTKPFLVVVGVEEEVAPDFVFEGCQFPARGLGAVAKDGDVGGKDVVNGERG